jgi:hypothetical protein
MRRVRDYAETRTKFWQSACSNKPFCSDRTIFFFSVAELQTYVSNIPLVTCHASPWLYSVSPSELEENRTYYIQQPRRDICDSYSDEYE